MTEMLVVLISALCSLILVDPFYDGTLTNSPFGKSVVLILGFGSLGFHLVGRALTAPARLRAAVAEMLSDWWPLLLLGAYIASGSSFAIWARGTKESFLGMGLGMIYLPLVGLAIRSSDSPLRFMKWLGVIYILTALSMLGLLIFSNHLFHESIYLLIPLGAYFLSAVRPKVWQIGLGLALLLLCAFSVKNTTFGMMLATLAMCLLVMCLRLIKTTNRLAAVTVLYFGVLAIAVSGVALALAWTQYQSLLPSGNLEYRAYMYKVAWQRFLDSPVWGSGWLDASVTYFPLYKIPLGTQNLPTHSDLLDILAQGGLISIALWAVVPWRIGRMAVTTVRKLVAAEDASDLRPWRWMFVLVLIQMNAVITYAVNPPLIGPAKGYWIWGTLGLLWALHRELAHGELAVNAPARRLGKTALA